jgi:hypothetical protein
MSLPVDSWPVIPGLCAEHYHGTGIADTENNSAVQNASHEGERPPADGRPSLERDQGKVECGFPAESRDQQRP